MLLVAGCAPQPTQTEALKAFNQAIAEGDRQKAIQIAKNIPLTAEDKASYEFQFTKLPPDPQGSAKGLEALNAATGAWADHDYPKALHLFDLAAQYDPSQRYSVEFNKAYILFQMNRKEEAKKLFQEVSASNSLEAANAKAFLKKIDHS
jgi:tetratricopeptide (TPR) repeat protein